MSVYLPAVTPGINPGGLWVRICAGEDLVDEHPLSLSEALEPTAEGDALTALAAASEHGEARTYIYDGDSGSCFVTLITSGDDTAAEVPQ